MLSGTGKRNGAENETKKLKNNKINMDKKVSIIAPDCPTADLFDKTRFDIVVQKKTTGRNY
jgi:hypothetical protein